MAELSKPRVLAVVGPTATGKTALGVQLARHFGGEIISADSMQIYRWLDVGTAKVTPQEAQGIPHHCVDILSPEQPFSVADFTALAGRHIREITTRGAVPVLVGGTGLYVESLLEGIRFAPEKTDPALRAALTQELARRGAQEMYRELETLDPAAAREIHPNNTVRVLRALEHYRATGRPLSEQKAASRPAEKPYASLILGLDTADRSVLYGRIDARVDRMMEAGLLEEARLVYDHRDSYRTAAQAIGYKEFFPYFAGTASLEACIPDLKRASRRYAKRQLTWFRRMEGICWLEAGAADTPAQAFAAAERFLKGGRV